MESWWRLTPRTSCIAAMTINCSTCTFCWGYQGAGVEQGTDYQGAGVEQDPYYQGTDVEQGTGVNDGSVSV